MILRLYEPKHEEKMSKHGKSTISDALNHVNINERDRNPPEIVWEKKKELRAQKNKHLTFQGDFWN